MLGLSVASSNWQLASHTANVVSDRLMYVGYALASQVGLFEIVTLLALRIISGKQDFIVAISLRRDERSGVALQLGTTLLPNAALIRLISAERDGYFGCGYAALV